MCALVTFNYFIYLFHLVHTIIIFYCTFCCKRSNFLLFLFIYFEVLFISIVVVISWRDVSKLLVLTTKCPQNSQKLNSSQELPPPQTMTWYRHFRSGPFVVACARSDLFIWQMGREVYKELYDLRWQHFIAISFSLVHSLLFIECGGKFTGFLQRKLNKLWCHILQCFLGRSYMYECIYEYLYACKYGNNFLKLSFLIWGDRVT